jgi:hypothetical protein
MIYNSYGGYRGAFTTLQDVQMHLNHAATLCAQIEGRRRRYNVGGRHGLLVPQELAHGVAPVPGKDARRMSVLRGDSTQPHSERRERGRHVPRPRTRALSGQSARRPARQSTRFVL